jgi:hypothetical protein
MWNSASHHGLMAPSPSHLMVCQGSIMWRLRVAAGQLKQIVHLDGTSCFLDGLTVPFTGANVARKLCDFTELQRRQASKVALSSVLPATGQCAQSPLITVMADENRTTSCETLVWHVGNEALPAEIKW